MQTSAPFSRGPLKKERKGFDHMMVVSHGEHDGAHSYCMDTFTGSREVFRPLLQHTEVASTTYLLMSANVLGYQHPPQLANKSPHLPLLAEFFKC